jgi:hypothetical protein
MEAIMSNVVSLFNPSAATNATMGERLSLMEQLERKGIFYTVEGRENLTYDNDGKIIATGKKTIFNATNNTVLGVMGEGYNIVQNEKIFEAFNRVIAKSNINLEGAYTRCKTHKAGQKAMVEYVFPALKKEVKVGDAVAPSIVAINSFDGTGSFHVRFGLYRLICLNGMIMGSTVFEYKKNHTKDLSVDFAADVIYRGIQCYESGINNLKKQTTTPVTDQTVYLALAELSGFDKADFSLAPTYADYLAKMRPLTKRPPALDAYMALWGKYSTELGNTEWALHNVMTHISTHGKGFAYDTKNSVTDRLKKENLMGVILNRYGMALAA